MLRTWRLPALLLAAASAVYLAGCNSDERQAPPGKPAEPGDQAHAHKPGAHGGLIVPIGADSYHAEVVFEKEGVLRFFTLGKDEARVLEVEAQPLTA